MIDQGAIQDAIFDRIFLGSHLSRASSLWIAAHRIAAWPFLIAPRAWRYQASLSRRPVNALCAGWPVRFERIVAPALSDVGKPRPGRPLGVLRPAALAPDRVGADLVMAEVHPWMAGRFRRAGWLVVPERVQWTGSPFDLPPAQPSRSLRSDLARLARGTLTVQIDRHPGAGAWAAFFAEMVDPLIRRRFGHRAWITSDVVRRTFARRGRLLIVSRGPERVAGACLLERDDTVWMPVLGVRGGEQALVREGAIAAIYSGAVDWARRRGARLIDFGLTSALRHDGLVWYKRKWGLEPSPSPISPLVALAAAPARPDVRAALSRAIAFERTTSTALGRVPLPAGG